MAIYFIGDLHLFTKSQTNEGSVNYDDRPFDTVAEMNKTILENHNKRVTNGDTTVFVGDMSMERPQFLRLLEVLQEGDTLVVCKLDRFDSTAFKKVLPDLYKAYTKQVSSRRFSISV